MDVKYQLLAYILSDVVYKKVEAAFNELEEWADATAMVMLYEIWQIIDDKSISDSDTVKKIIELYENHNLDCSVHSVE